MDTIFPEIGLDPFFILFRHPGNNESQRGTDGILQEKTQKKEKTANTPFLLCKSCGYKITTPSAAISVGNSHRHTFANPAGLLFDIGCFRSAPGCLNTGPFTDEFSWFKGYKWRISLCESCHSHIGWMFGSANHLFFGLIIDRLTGGPHPFSDP